MIRLRRKDGNTLPLPDMAYLEITDLEGAIAVILYSDAEGNVHMVRKTDPEAETYQRMFPDVKFVDLVSI